MGIHGRTQATLAQLESAAWFSKVGVRDAQHAVVLSSWTEAVEYCSSLDWEDLRLEAANCYRERLLERSLERFRRWNEVVGVVKEVALPLVRRKTRPVVEEHALPQVFVDTVQWDILHLCMEAEYADVYPPGFYASQGYWYAQGHFPCGWQGDFPSGMLVIF